MLFICIESTTAQRIWKSSVSRMFADIYFILAKENAHTATTKSQRAYVCAYIHSICVTWNSIYICMVWKKRLQLCVDFRVHWYHNRIVRTPQICILCCTLTYIHKRRSSFFCNSQSFSVFGVYFLSLSLYQRLFGFSISVCSLVFSFFIFRFVFHRSASLSLYQRPFGLTLNDFKWC